MCFVGKESVNDVIPGTNISGDLIAVAFLIWDSTLWALESSSIPQQAGLLMHSSEGTQEGKDPPGKHSQMFYSCTVAS